MFVVTFELHGNRESSVLDNVVKGGSIQVIDDYPALEPAIMFMNED